MPSQEPVGAKTCPPGHMVMCVPMPKIPGRLDVPGDKVRPSMHCMCVKTSGIIDDPIVKQ